MIRKPSENRVCAFCKLDHRVYLKKEVSVFDATLLMAVTGLLAYAIWGGPDIRSLLIFITMAFLFQVFLRVRFRESVKCPHCGFDPILYGQEPEKAAQKVKAYMEQRKNNPQYLLRPRPNIQPIYKTKQEIEEEQSRILALENSENGKPLDLGAIEPPQILSDEPQPFL